VIASIRRETGRRRARRVQTLVPLLLLSTVAGCTGLFHSDARPEQVYFLRANTVARGDPARVPAEASVRVAHPAAAPGRESAQIVLVQADRRMGFYSASRWPATIPEVVEALAVETLRASGSWQSVEDSASPFPSDFLLQITVRRFEAEYSEGGHVPEVHVALDCVIGRREGRDVLASFVAEGSSRAAANKLSDVTAAFEIAANAALGSLSEQALAAIRNAPERKGPEHRRP
jgi:ABC-type uncharacterized transport system auxiliary subunit